MQYQTAKSLLPLKNLCLSNGYYWWTNEDYCHKSSLYKIWPVYYYLAGWMHQLLLANIGSEDSLITTISSNLNIATDIIINGLYVRIQSLLKSGFSVFWRLYKNMALLNRISITLMRLAFQWTWYQQQRLLLALNLEAGLKQYNQGIENR